MELIQVNWDQNQKLFLKFQKDPDEVDKVRPENVKRINVQYDIYRDTSGPHQLATQPFWFSTKKSFFSISSCLIDPFKSNGPILILVSSSK